MSPLIFGGVQGLRKVFYFKQDPLLGSSRYCFSFVFNLTMCFLSYVRFSKFIKYLLFLSPCSYHLALLLTMAPFVFCSAIFCNSSLTRLALFANFVSWGFWSRSTFSCFNLQSRSISLPFLPLESRLEKRIQKSRYYKRTLHLLKHLNKYTYWLSRLAASSCIKETLLVFVNLFCDSPSLSMS